MTVEIISLSKTQNNPSDLSNVAVKIDTKDVYDTDRTSEINLLFTALVNGGITKIIVNMDELTFIDSHGISTLIIAAKKIREKKGDIVLINVPEQIERILRPVNFPRFIKTFASMNEAVQYMRFL